ncbi:alpha/beta fold hydrolase [Salinarimonas soli]|uniref:Alpha/beta hydrolase n=1 Tax=Salinarimonas soli TaxID=1638099 RepID=A0A5B2VSB1_9HYPH|nr:alpha/beta hydrolase [Salinarimonas soli]KAA2241236.1 alpha/beta hydrolase [Salinarimonas soli]
MGFVKWGLLGLVCLVVAVLLAGAVATRVIAARVAADNPPLGRFVEIPGGRLHVIEAGAPDAPPIVLLHGASGSASDSMGALGRRLAERYRVLAFDRPGHGWSDRITPEAASPAVQARLVREGLRAMGVERPIVVGHSFAGAVATAFALDHPDALSGLVLLSPVSHPWPGGEITWYYGPATSPWLGPLFTRTVTTPIGAFIIDGAANAVFRPQAAPPDYVKRAQAALVLRPSAFEANAGDVAGLYDFVKRQSGRYGAIKAPTAIIAGDADRIVWTDLHSRSLEREIPGARLVVIPGMGHMPHWTAVDTIVAEIDRLTGAMARR